MDKKVSIDSPVSTDKKEKKVSIDSPVSTDKKEKKVSIDSPVSTDKNKKKKIKAERFNGEIEYVDMMNMYHKYYKKYNSINKTQSMVLDYNEMLDFKKNVLDEKNNQQYLQPYDKDRNTGLLRKYGTIYHAIVNSKYAYTSSNIILLLKQLIQREISIDMMDVEREEYSL